MGRFVGSTPTAALYRPTDINPIRNVSLEEKGGSAETGKEQRLKFLKGANEPKLGQANSNSHRSFTAVSYGVPNGVPELPLRFFI